MFADYLRSHLADVRAKLLDLVGRLQDADLDFRPYESAWTVRELVLHIGHEEYGEVQHGITKTLGGWPAEFPAAEFPSVVSMMAKLTEVRAATLVLVDSLHDEDLDREVELPWGARATILSLVGHVLEHEVHHRAELSLILGMVGRPGLDA